MSTDSKKPNEIYHVIGQDGKPFSQGYEKPYPLEGPYSGKHRWALFREVLPGEILVTREKVAAAISKFGLGGSEVVLNGVMRVLCS